MSAPPRGGISYAQILRYRLPIPLKIIFTATAIIWLLSASIVFSRPDQLGEILQIGLIFLLPVAVLWFNNAGYRVGYDDQRLYMRSSNFWNRRVRWPDYHSIAFGDMALIEGRTQNAGPPPETRLVPHEYLAVVSARPEDKEVWIYPAALHEAELAELLAVLLRRRPDLLPEHIAERVREASHPSPA